jgi:subtilisin family serine protease
MQWNTKHLLSLLLVTVSISFAAPLELIIKYKENNNKINSISKTLQSSKLVSKMTSFKDKYPQTKLFKNNYIIKASSSENYLQLLEDFENDENIEYVHPNYIYKIQVEPNDTNYLTTQKIIMDLYNMEQAWGITTGNSNIIVAVVDTGVDLNHPDLWSRLLPGYDYVNNDSSPDDDEGHGTHVAGIIGAIGNNSSGITGMCWNVSILPVKVMDSNGEGDLSDIFLGIEYAYNHGAKVINLSLGGSYSDLFQSVIDDAYNAGAIIVAAAGNGGLDNIGDNLTLVSKMSPVCNDGNSNKIIGVASIGTSLSKSSYSNYSSNYVDICAIGESILSTYPNDTYAALSGTSMAAPAVSGIIALLLSLAPDLSPAQVMDYINKTAFYIDNYNFSYVGKLGAGLINANELLLLYKGTQSSTKNTEEILQFYNYPNPVDSSTIVENSTTFYAEFTSPVSNAKISIYSLTGRKVAELEVNQLPSTHLFFAWNLSANSLNVLPSGPYFAMIKANINGSDVTKYQKVLIK